MAQPVVAPRPADHRAAGAQATPHSSAAALASSEAARRLLSEDIVRLTAHAERLEAQLICQKSEADALYEDVRRQRNTAEAAGAAGEQRVRQLERAVLQADEGERHWQAAQVAEMEGRRADAAEERADAADQRAEVAEERAAVQEQRALAAEQRVANLGEGRLAGEGQWAAAEQQEAAEQLAEMRDRAEWAGLRAADAQRQLADREEQRAAAEKEAGMGRLLVEGLEEELTQERQRADGAEQLAADAQRQLAGLEGQLAGEKQRADAAEQLASQLASQLAGLQLQQEARQHALIMPVPFTSTTPPPQAPKQAVPLSGMPGEDDARKQRGAVLTSSAGKFSNSARRNALAKISQQPGSSAGELSVWRRRKSGGQQELKLAGHVTGTAAVGSPARGLLGTPARTSSSASIASSGVRG